MISFKRDTPAKCSHNVKISVRLGCIREENKEKNCTKPLYSLYLSIINNIS